MDCPFNVSDVEMTEGGVLPADGYYGGGNNNNSELSALWLHFLATRLCMKESV